MINMGYLQIASLVFHLFTHTLKTAIYQDCKSRSRIQLNSLRDQCILCPSHG